MPLIYLRRLRGWRFLLFNLVLGLGHITVLFSLGSYIALLPHVAGDWEGCCRASAPGRKPIS
jgi:DHA2 family multidrug resistance protein